VGSQRCHSLGCKASTRLLHQPSAAAAAAFAAAVAAEAAEAEVVAVATAAAAAGCHRWPPFP